MFAILGLKGDYYFQNSEERAASRKRKKLLVQKTFCIIILLMIYMIYLRSGFSASLLLYIAQLLWAIGNSLATLAAGDKACKISHN